MSDDLTTKPTLETLLEMMRSMRDEMRAGFESVNQRLDVIEERLERVETRLDRVESMALETRADLRDLKKQVKGEADRPDFSRGIVGRERDKPPR